TRIIADHQHVVRADWEDTRPLGARHQRRLLTALRRQAPRLHAVVLSDYDKGVLTELLLGELLELCRAKRVPVFIDLKRPRALEPGVTLVLLNQRRAEELSGSGIENDNRLGIVGRSLMAQFPCKVLVITRGSAGMVVFENHDRFHFEAVRTRPWEVFDVTGAGDTVLATLTLATVAGAVPREAVALANAAAGIVVGKLGTAVCTPRELLAALR
ncbi:MAG: bifunctional heptose 7-phosphate kinase/heptose 1-phosphate adenyltransferase, partial [Terriglobia bacterium]